MEVSQPLVVWLMRIIVDISPIDKSSTSEHKVRGVGKYITLLKENLEKFDDKNTYIFSSNPEKEKDADLIHYPYFDPFFVTLPIIKKKKSLVTVHDLIPISHKEEFPVGIKGELKWKINKGLLRRTDGILTDSYASKEVIHKMTGISEKLIFPVYLAVEAEFRKLEIGNWSASRRMEIKRKYGLPDNFILYVGDVTWNKNLPNIVSAIQKTGIPIVMVGHALKEELFDFKNPWNKSRKIVLEKTYGNPLFLKLGFVPTEDLVMIYNLAHLLLMPSFDEGFGLPVLEALKSGCPVITSNCGSLSEVAGDAAVYVDPESIDSIINGIYEVVKSKQLSNKLRSIGFLQADKFSIQKMIKDTVMVYQSFNDEK